VVRVVQGDQRDLEVLAALAALEDPGTDNTTV